MTASRQDPGPETPVVRPGNASSAPSGMAATGGAPIPPSAPQSGAPGEQLAGQAKSDAERAASAARATADEVSGQARSRSEQLKERAQGLVGDAQHRARSAAEAQKNSAAERLTGFADALRHASSDLDEQGQGMVAGIVRQAAGGLEHVSDAVRRNDVDDLIGSVEDFARRQPAVFIGSAVLAGFGIARFVKSSAERRHGHAAAHDVEAAARSGPTYQEGGI